MFFKNSKEIKQRCFWLVYWSHGGFSNHVGSCFSVYVLFVYPYWGTLLIRVRFSRSPLSLFLSCYLGRWDRFHTCRRPADYLGQVKEVNIHLHQPPGENTSDLFVFYDMSRIVTPNGEEVCFLCWWVKEEKIEKDTKQTNRCKCVGAVHVLMNSLSVPRGDRRAISLVIR